MGDAEGGALGLQHGEARVLLVRRVQLGDEGLVRPLGEDALLVEEGKQAAVRRREEGDGRDVRDRLGVELRRRHALGLGLGLRRAEDDRIEDGLQMLVAEVDQELLERVGLEVLKAEDVEQPDKRPRAAPSSALAAAVRAGNLRRVVDGCDEPVEESAVQRLPRQHTHAPSRAQSESSDPLLRSRRLGEPISHLCGGGARLRGLNELPARLREASGEARWRARRGWTASHRRPP